LGEGKLCNEFEFVSFSGVPEICRGFRKCRDTL